ncbi:MAG: CPBP family intramembrane glutamic endopeptidase [Arenimonas sp.]
MSEQTLPQAGLPLRIWRHPVTQMFARVLAFLLITALIAWAVHLLLPPPTTKGGPAAALAESGLAAWRRLFRYIFPVVAGYWLMVRLLERRKLSELAPSRLPIDIATGWFTGMAILIAAAGALALAGCYSVRGFHPDAPLLTPLLVLGVGAGVVEEIITRGILFRVVEEALGTWFAMVLSALFFGAAHLANPNASIWMAAAIAVEAGFLLAMAYAWTRSLWFVMALHAAWNFTQGPLLGISVSGIAVNGLLDSSMRGPAVLSGGEFGAEGSILTVIICVALGVWFTRRAQARGRIVPPFWRRRDADGRVPPLRFEESPAQ